MDYQPPAEGILLEKDLGANKYYTVYCECGDEKHRIKLSVETDDNLVTVSHYVNITSCWWNDKPTKFDFVNAIVHRLVTTWHLWTKGYVECESHILLNEQTALNFSETLKKAIQDVKEIKEKTGNQSR